MNGMDEIGSKLRVAACLMLTSGVTACAHITPPETIATRIYELCAEPPQHSCHEQGWCSETQLVSARANSEGRVWLETQLQTTSRPDVIERSEASRQLRESMDEFYARSGIERPTRSTPRIFPTTFEIFRVEAFAQVRNNGRSYLMFRCAPFDDCIITSYIPDEVEMVSTSGVPCVDAEAAAAYFEDHVVRWQSPYS
ncbi:MAG: hypothetical protein VX501_09150 [Pseudomonadota bacterium]|nr:hypothetical protein [Pseudomonadota bacterium]